jgi:hypothetical protein
VVGVGEFATVVVLVGLEPEIAGVVVVVLVLGLQADSNNPQDTETTRNKEKNFFMFYSQHPIYSIYHKRFLPARHAFRLFELFEPSTYNH